MEWSVVYVKFSTDLRCWNVLGKQFLFVWQLMWTEILICVRNSNAVAVAKEPNPVCSMWLGKVVMIR